MTVIGIDADTQRLAWGLLQSDPQSPLGLAGRAGTIQRTNTKGRFEADWDWALKVFMIRAYERGAMVYLEGIYLAEDINPARNIETYRQLAIVQGEVLQAARVSCVPIAVVMPQTWHARVLGLTRGREAVKAAARDKVRWVQAEPLSEHEADALCVALYGWADSTEAVG